MPNRDDKAPPRLAQLRRYIKHGRDIGLSQQLAALAKIPESAIDTSDIPEFDDWSRAQVGRFYRSKTERTD